VRQAADIDTLRLFPLCLSSVNRSGWITPRPRPHLGSTPAAPTGIRWCFRTCGAFSFGFGARRASQADAAAHAIRRASPPGKDYLSWAHACGTWDLLRPDDGEKSSVTPKRCWRTASDPAAAS